MAGSPGSSGSGDVIRGRASYALATAKIDLLRAEVELLRAEEARLNEEKRRLSDISRPLPFANSEFITCNNPIVSYEGQMNSLGLAHGWGTAKRANGDVAIGDFADGLCHGLCVVRSSTEGVLLSRFADDYPIDIGLAWSADYQRVVQLSNGAPTGYINSAEVVSRLVHQHLGDGSIDLLSSLDPPLLVGRLRHRSTSVALDPPKQAVTAMRASSPTSRRRDDSSLPGLNIPEVNSPAPGSMGSHRVTDGSLRRAAPTKPRATPNVELPDVRSPVSSPPNPTPQPRVSSSGFSATPSTAPMRDERPAAPAHPLPHAQSLLAASSRLFDRSPSPAPAQHKV
jgi:hypothetical protein